MFQLNWIRKFSFYSYEIKKAFFENLILILHNYFIYTLINFYVIFKLYKTKLYSRLLLVIQNLLILCIFCSICVFIVQINNENKKLLTYLYQSIISYFILL
jgi:magnesium-transporting ATPase (P-type)